MDQTICVQPTRRIWKEGTLVLSFFFFKLLLGGKSMHAVAEAFNPLAVSEPTSSVSQRKLNTISSLGIPQDSSTKLEWLGHPVSWTQQLQDS